jgi:hypothetical protein
MHRSTIDAMHREPVELPWMESDSLLKEHILLRAIRRKERYGENR